MTDTLRGLVPKALEILKCELEGETPLPAAVHVLKACGLYGMSAPHGPTEVDDIDLAQRRRVYERKLASLDVGTDEDLDIAQRRRAYERMLTGLATGPV
jgi:hypothetical protein